MTISSKGLDELSIIIPLTQNVSKNLITEQNVHVCSQLYDLWAKIIIIEFKSDSSICIFKLLALVNETIWTDM